MFEKKFAMLRQGGGFVCRFMSPTGWFVESRRRDE